VPCASYVSCIWRGLGVWRGAFFLGVLRLLLGTPDASLDGVAVREFEAEAGSLRLELKEDINSIDCGDSPSRLLK
jgi:hypothetical protein